MAILRQLEAKLQQWKESPYRKPLIIRGARQVGKTTLVKQFSKNYRHSILLNLEKAQDSLVFEKFTETSQLLEFLFLANKIPASDKENTLLFIDEIQESPEAIAILRYFYEEHPELHVIAAGSLLEFALKDVKSFPVGRVEFLHLHPLNFPEYLAAHDREDLVQMMRTIPIPLAAHHTLLDYFHRYALIGGMPEVVQRDIDGADIVALNNVYESLWTTYKADIVKYAKNSTERKVINHIMGTAPLHLDNRIKFQGFGNSNYKSREVGEAFKAIHDTGLIRLIYPTTSTVFPAMPSINRAPRLQFLDTGLLNYKSGIQTSLIGIKDLNAAYKGSLIPHLVTQELISVSQGKLPSFWVREKTQSSAEVDLVQDFKGHVLPIEVKSGAKGTLKSLSEFIDASDHNWAIRLYAGEWLIQANTTRRNKNYLLLNLPYYLGTSLPMDWLLEQEVQNPKT